MENGANDASIHPHGPFWGGLLDAQGYQLDAARRDSRNLLIKPSSHDFKDTLEYFQRELESPKSITQILKENFTQFEAAGIVPSVVSMQRSSDHLKANAERYRKFLHGRFRSYRKQSGRLALKLAMSYFGLPVEAEQSSPSSAGSKLGNHHHPYVQSRQKSASKSPTVKKLVRYEDEENRETGNGGNNTEATTATEKIPEQVPTEKRSRILTIYGLQGRVQCFLDDIDSINQAIRRLLSLDDNEPGSFTVYWYAEATPGATPGNPIYCTEKLPVYQESTLWKMSNLTTFYKTFILAGTEDSTSMCPPLEPEPTPMSDEIIRIHWKDRPDIDLLREKYDSSVELSHVAYFPVPKCREEQKLFTGFANWEQWSLMGALKVLTGSLGDDLNHCIYGFAKGSCQVSYTGYGLFTVPLDKLLSLHHSSKQKSFSNAETEIRLLHHPLPRNSIMFVLPGYYPPLYQAKSHYLQLRKDTTSDYIGEKAIDIVKNILISCYGTLNNIEYASIVLLDTSALSRLNVETVRIFDVCVLERDEHRTTASHKFYHPDKLGEFLNQLAQPEQLCVVVPRFKHMKIYPGFLEKDGNQSADYLSYVPTSYSKQELENVLYKLFWRSGMLLPHSDNYFVLRPYNPMGKRHSLRDEKDRILCHERQRSSVAYYADPQVSNFSIFSMFMSHWKVEVDYLSRLPKVQHHFEQQDSIEGFGPVYSSEKWKGERLGMSDEEKIQAQLRSEAEIAFQYGNMMPPLSATSEVPNGPPTGCPIQDCEFSTNSKDVLDLLDHIEEEHHLTECPLCGEREFRFWNYRLKISHFIWNHSNQYNQTFYRPRSPLYQGPIPKGYNVRRIGSLELIQILRPMMQEQSSNLLECFRAIAERRMKIALHGGGPDKNDEASRAMRKLTSDELCILGSLSNFADDNKLMVIMNLIGQILSGRQETNSLNPHLSLSSTPETKDIKQEPLDSDMPEEESLQESPRNLITGLSKKGQQWFSNLADLKRSIDKNKDTEEQWEMLLDKNEDIRSQKSLDLLSVILDSEPGDLEELVSTTGSREMSFDEGQPGEFEAEELSALDLPIFPPGSPTTYLSRSSSRFSSNSSSGSSSRSSSKSPSRPPSSSSSSASSSSSDSSHAFPSKSSQRLPVSPPLSLPPALSSPPSEGRSVQWRPQEEFDVRILPPKSLDTPDSIFSPSGNFPFDSNKLLWPESRWIKWREAQYEWPRTWYGINNESSLNYLPSFDAYCSRCLMKVPVHRQDRIEAMEIHTNPLLSCGIPNRLGSGKYLPNLSGWVPPEDIEGGEGNISTIRSNFKVRFPDYAQTIYPLYDGILRSFSLDSDVNQNSNKDFRQLPWPPLLLPLHDARENSYRAPSSPPSLAIHGRTQNRHSSIAEVLFPQPQNVAAHYNRQNESSQKSSVTPGPSTDVVQTGSGISPDKRDGPKRKRGKKGDENYQYFSDTDSQDSLEPDVNDLDIQKKKRRRVVDPTFRPDRHKEDPMDEDMNMLPVRKKRGKSKGKRKGGLGSMVTKPG